MEETSGNVILTFDAFSRKRSQIARDMRLRKSFFSSLPSTSYKRSISLCTSLCLRAYSHRKHFWYKTTLLSNPNWTSSSATSFVIFGRVLDFSPLNGDRRHSTTEANSRVTMDQRSDHQCQSIQHPRKAIGHEVEKHCIPCCSHIRTALKTVGWTDGTERTSIVEGVQIRLDAESRL